VPSDGPFTKATPPSGTSPGSGRPYGDDHAEADGRKRLARLDSLAEEVGRRSRRLLLGHDAVGTSAPVPVEETHRGGGDGVRA
jgi:hypothetical protein